jgi:hypothetical protein
MLKTIAPAPANNAFITMRHVVRQRRREQTMLHDRDGRRRIAVGARRLNQHALSPQRSANFHVDLFETQPEFHSSDVEMREVISQGTRSRAARAAHKHPTVQPNTERDFRMEGLLRNEVTKRSRKYVRRRRSVSRLLPSSSLPAYSHHFRAVHD